MQTMDPAPLSPSASRAQAEELWKNAQKLRKEIERNIEPLKRGASEKSVIVQLKKLEEDLAEFRLGFVQTLAMDLAYAYEEDTEDAVWKLHINVNRTYRGLVYTTFRGHEVTRRKVENKWVAFLRVAAAFYRTYFQRLQIFHGMPQIPRVNRALQLAGSSAVAAHHGSASTEALEKSFHSTLLHLGDISRWKAKAQTKAQAKSQSKPVESSTAVLYYELAHDLNPTSGLAQHQLGIMEESNHLRIVYHLYRAAAIEVPHPMALINLEQHFRKLSGPSHPRRNFSPDPNDAFAYWFSKLHAYLYKGEDYPQELEDEVLHRLETALKRPDALSLVLKMVLTNIAAYYIAKSRIQQEWSIGASSSCQFILRHNVRWVVVLSRLLQTELQDAAKSTAPAVDESHSTSGERAKGPVRSSAFTDTILPLTRIYMAWVYIYRTDLVDYQDHLGLYIFDMYKVLASGLTLMVSEFNTGVVGSSPYLLTEDSEALGLKPFDDVALAPECKLHHEANKASFKRHWEDCSFPRNPPEQEMLARVYDWINCGFVLALDARFPLSISSEPGQAIKVVYLEGGKPAAPTAAAMGLDPIHTQVSAEGSRLVQQLDKNGAVGVPEMEAQNDGPLDDLILASVAPAQPRPGRESPTINDLLEAEPNSGIKERMRSLVDDLLDGDSGARKTSSATHSHTTARVLDGRPASSLHASTPPFSPKPAPQGGYEQYGESLSQHGAGPGRTSAGVVGSGSNGPAHVGQRFGGSTDSFYSGGSPFLPRSPEADAPAHVATVKTPADGRVKSPIFGFNSSWTRAFDPNASSLPPINSPWGLPGAHLRAQPDAQPNDSFAQGENSAAYQHYPAAQNADQYQMPQYQTISNGRAYNGTTAYGRGDPPSTEDPSYFRNAVQGLHHAAALKKADAYDQAVLRSAFTPER